MTKNFFKNINYFLSFIALFILLCSGSCSGRPDRTITINGSTTMAPIMNKIATIYMKDRDALIVLNTNGSKTGIKNLIDGNCDIAASSVEITPDLRKKAEKEGIQLREFVLAYDIVTPVVNPSNPVKNLTLEQLRQIYSGKLLNWSEVGGRHAKISVVGRDQSSGTNDVWQKIVTKQDTIREDAKKLDSNSSVLAEVSADPDAIGYISLGFTNNEVKILSIDGIIPNTKNVMKDKYPIYRELYLYVNENKFSFEMKSFIIYLLSNKGQEIVRESGFIPLNQLGQYHSIGSGD